ncbi:cellular retinoic acid-binding protein 2-like [Ptychodera flava]|uniref:cellular retinoic acid-binding protein 2-like n=1 Tax=Ptychodera flava TaxID=63121 RepID=UPI00396A5424
MPGTTPKNFSGKWKQYKTENLEVLLKKMGVGLLHRGVVAKVTPSLEITQNGDRFTIRTITTFRTVELKFTVGEEFEDTVMNGDTRMAVAYWDGDKLIVKAVADDADQSQITERELVGADEFVVILIYQGVVAKRYFTRET